MHIEAQYSGPDSDTYLHSDEARAMKLKDGDADTAEGALWASEGHRWDNPRKAADIGRIIDDAMDAIEKENEALQGILPKNFNRRELSPTVLGGLIDTFSRSDLADEERKDEDLLGRVYEYMLGRYAADEGKSGGEFYTPRSVVSLLTEMIRPYRGRIYDPCCGSGGMFIQAEKFVEAHAGHRNDLSRYSQEDLDYVADQMNRRPRKRRDYATPYEILSTRLLQ